MMARLEIVVKVWFSGPRPRIEKVLELRDMVVGEEVWDRGSVA
jgi:hypothetical protein